MKLTKIFLSVIFAGSCWSVSLAEKNLSPEIDPVSDLSVVRGKLSNGLSYYILPSKNSGNEADFFLARKVGSVNEEDNERGLAHFLEHLCFNGSKHFPGNSVITYLESVGVKFGKNLNAYTSTDRTVYNISKVPTSRSTTIDSCLLILRDWSGDLSLNKRDIDGERDVIHEEWRQRRSANNRMLEKALPSLFPDNRYGERLPIGSMEVVDNASVKTIRNFYKKWNRPDNEALIIVGDVNPLHIETKIKELFSDLKNPKTPINIFIDVPVNNGLISVVATDPEQPVESMTLYFKYPRHSTMEIKEDIRTELISQLLRNILVERFNNLELAENTVCSRIGIGEQKYIMASPVRALMIRANIATGKSEKGVNDIYTVLRTAMIHGFSNSEMEEAGKEVINSFSKAAAKSSLRSNTDMANRLVRTFLDGERFDTPEERLAFALELLPEISGDDVQKYLKSIVEPDGKNITILYYAPDDIPGIDKPVAENLSASFLSVNNEVLPPYTPSVISMTLLEEEPTKGSLVSTEPAEPFGMEKITLSNGIEVFLKPTHFNNDEIYVMGVGTGGFSQRFSQDLAADMKVLEDVIPLCGFGKLSSSDIRRFLNGRNMKVSSSISNTEERLELVSDSVSLEDAFRLLYLKATDIRKDTPAFNAFYESKQHSLARIFNNPVQVMGDSITSIVYSHHPLGAKLKLETLKSFNLDSALSIYKDRFADCSDFKFYISGDFNRSHILDLLERYVASLPAFGRIEKPKDIGYKFPKGKNRYEFTAPMETPLGVVYQFRHLECPYTLENILTASAIGSILKSKLLADLREDKGWTYSITGHGALINKMNGDDLPVFMMPVHIKTAPEHVKEIDIVISETITKMGEGDISESEVDKVRNYFLKNIEENRRDNGYWLVAMHGLNKFGLDLDSDYERSVTGLTAESISGFIKQYILPANLTTIVMTPEE